MTPQDYLRSCSLCPRDCGANRLDGYTGFCGAKGPNVKVAAAMLHQWEEPCISGTRGSGAVFFSHCTLRCVFCQNQAIRSGQIGIECSPTELAALFLDLEDQGAHNINLVTPTHYVAHLLEAIPAAKAQGLSIPILYNTSGYERPETLALLDGLIDIYLPDFKYLDESLARRYSFAPDYPAIAWRSLEIMVKQVGSPCFGRRGKLKSGVIVRHLVLPGQTEAAKQILAKLHKTYGDQILISLMNQYTPMGHLESYSELTRGVSDQEYQEVLAFAREQGITNAYIQEGGTISESFVPPFAQLAEECRKRMDTWKAPQ